LALYYWLSIVLPRLLYVKGNKPSCVGVHLCALFLYLEMSKSESCGGPLENLGECLVSGSYKTDCMH